MRETTPAAYRRAASQLTAYVRYDIFVNGRGRAEASKKAARRRRGVQGAGDGSHKGAGDGSHKAAAEQGRGALAGVPTVQDDDVRA